LGARGDKAMPELWGSSSSGFSCIDSGLRTDLGTLVLALAESRPALEVEQFGRPLATLEIFQRIQCVVAVLVFNVADSDPVYRQDRELPVCIVHS
jgi:hypothetical protein